MCRFRQIASKSDKSTATGGGRGYLARALRRGRSARCLLPRTIRATAIADGSVDASSTPHTCPYLCYLLVVHTCGIAVCYSLLDAVPIVNDATLACDPNEQCCLCAETLFGEVNPVANCRIRTTRPATPIRSPWTTSAARSHWGVVTVTLHQIVNTFYCRHFTECHTLLSRCTQQLIRRFFATSRPQTA